MSTGAENGHDGPGESIARAVADFQAGIEREKNFRRLHDRFFRPTLRFFAKRAATEDALDLTQETFLRVYSGLDGFRRKSKFSTWLFQIAYNVFQKWCRRQHLRQNADNVSSADNIAAWEDLEPVVVAPESTQLERLAQKEHVQLLREAIEKLPDQMQKCLKLRLYQELSYKDIAEFMGISVNTVKAHLFQARDKLRVALQGTFAGIDF